MTRLTAIALALVVVLTPAVTLADAPDVPVANPSAKVESVRESCESRYAGQSLGSLQPSTYCEVYAWSELGKHYPELLDVARELQRQYNERTGELNETRKQLRRERQQTDKLSARIGQKDAEISRQMPRWIGYIAGAGALLVGGAIGYGIGQIGW